MHYSCINFDYLEDSDAQLISDLAFICPGEPHNAILGAGEPKVILLFQIIFNQKSN